MAVEDDSVSISAILTVDSVKVNEDKLADAIETIGDSAKVREDDFRKWAADVIKKDFDTRKETRLKVADAGIERFQNQIKSITQAINFDSDALKKSFDKLREIPGIFPKEDVIESIQESVEEPVKEVRKKNRYTPVSDKDIDPTTFTNRQLQSLNVAQAKSDILKQRQLDVMAARQNYKLELLEKQQAYKKQAAPKESPQTKFAKGMGGKLGIPMGYAALGAAVLAPFIATFTILKRGLSDIAKQLMSIATSTETFANVLNLLVMPFFVLFTLLFAPLLMAIAPVITQVVESLMGKQDVIMQLGQKLADVIMKLFDEDMLSYFIDAINLIITGIDWFLTIVDESFSNASDEGGPFAKIANAVTLLFMNLFNKILEWAGSPEGQEVITSVSKSIGMMLGSLAAAALAGLAVLVGTAILTTVEAIVVFTVTVIGGILNTIKNTISNVWNGITSTLSGLFNNIATAFSDGVEYVWKWITSVVTNAFNTIYNTIAGIGQWLSDRIDDVFSFISDPLGSVGSWFGGGSNNNTNNYNSSNLTINAYGTDTQQSDNIALSLRANNIW